jgi:RNA polymerase sigma factor (sigma-70 family)
MSVERDDDVTSSQRPSSPCQNCAGYSAIVSGFRTTRWSLVAGAAGASTQTRASLAELCQLYWPPVYTFVCYRGHDPDDARDLTQSFFARMLERNDLGRADPRRGRFRSWLLGALKHFLANERRRANALRNGGGTVTISINAIGEDGRHADEPTDPLTPERMYLRKWTLTVLDHAMTRLECAYATSSKRNHFEKLKSVLIGDESSYEALAGELGETVGTLRVQVHRLRRRYRDLLREEVGETVKTPSDVDHEIRELFAALL